MNHLLIRCQATSTIRFELYVDGLRLLSDYCVSYEQLLESTEADGQYYIFTCQCGDPSCIGIIHGVTVSHTDTITSWHVTDSVKQTYVFDRYKLLDQVQQARKQCIRLIKEQLLQPEASVEFEVFDDEQLQTLLSELVRPGTGG
jgi:hypothetical protein